MMRRNDKGFTLIELLIVVAIIGIIAAIAIPNLLNAIDRGKQKRTMADLRSVGTAIESYSIDNNLYPNAGTNMGTLSGVLERMSDNGWIDFRMFPNMAVVQGAGVGGGSLIWDGVGVSMLAITGRAERPSVLLLSGKRDRDPRAEIPPCP